jgi:hypothetical protein
MASFTTLHCASPFSEGADATRQCFSTGVPQHFETKCVFTDLTRVHKM